MQRASQRSFLAQVILPRNTVDFLSLSSYQGNWARELAKGQILILKKGKSFVNHLSTKVGNSLRKCGGILKEYYGTP